MKIFTVHEYAALTTEQQEKVSTWINNYDLETVTTVISDGETVTCYGVSLCKLFRSDGSVVLEANDEKSTLVRVAELEFDDFPWEVKHHG